LDKTIPVSPPVVNRNKKPKTHKVGEEKMIFLPYILANQLKIFTPVGTAIIIVAAVK
jgi:hypothetical protein